MIRRACSLLVRSVVENNRVSPRLATVFAFSAVALWQLVYGTLTAKWPPSFIWESEILLVLGLLGLGKLANTYKEVKVAEVTGVDSNANPPAGPQ